MPAREGRIERTHPSEEWSHAGHIGQQHGAVPDGRGRGTAGRGDAARRLRARAVRLEAVCAIAVMAKAPRPGHVKTRLQGLLTADEAAQMGAAFLRDTTANVEAAARTAPVHGYVAYAPAGEEAHLDGLLAPGTRLVLADGTGGSAPGVEGFGRSLLHATRTLLGMGYGAACVLSADSPTLPTAWLARAAERLLAPGRRAVFGPADDGGYWLLGMQTPECDLYAGVPWSTGMVAAATAEQARKIGLPLEGLGTWFDVDDSEGLQRLVREVSAPAQGTEGPRVEGPAAERPFAAPCTTRCVARLGLAERLGVAPAGLNPLPVAIGGH